MLVYHLILGAKVGASDDEIRTCYLDMIKRYPPEKDPAAFKVITVAYNAIKNDRARVRTTLFGTSGEAEPDEIIRAIAFSLDIGKRSPTLAELVQAERKASQAKQ